MKVLINTKPENMNYETIGERYQVEAEIVKAPKGATWLQVRLENGDLVSRKWKRDVPGHIPEKEVS